MTTRNLFAWAAAATTTLAVGATAPVEAAPVTYTLVPGQSTLTISGFYSGSAFSAQAPGSLVTSYSGTIAADRTASGITFTGGSAVDAADLATPQAPSRGGGGGTDSANYGIRFGANFQNYVGAARDFILDLNSGALTVAGGGTFAANTIDYTADSGVLQVELDGGGNYASRSFVGNVGVNQTASSGTLATANGVETLTLPVNMFFLYSGFSDFDSALRLTGTLVATRAIPEPTGLAAIAAGASMLLVRRRRA